MKYDEHGMYPQHPCKECGKPLNEDGGHPAELYAGTYTGLCYSCQNKGAFKVETLKSGALYMSHPPHCPSWRRNREFKIWFENCDNPECHHGAVTISRCYSQGGPYPIQCKTCRARHEAHPSTQEDNKKLAADRIFLANLYYKKALQAQAESDHSMHPQYKGHWDGDNWVVMVATKKITHLGRTIFNKGDKCLMDNTSMKTLTAVETSKKANIGKTFAVFYCHANHACNTSLRLDFFAPLT